MLTASEAKEIAEQKKICFENLNVFQKLRVIYESGRMNKRIEKAASRGELSAQIVYTSIGLSNDVHTVLEQIYKEKGYTAYASYLSFITSWEHPKVLSEVLSKVSKPPKGGTSMQEE